MTEPTSAQDLFRGRHFDQEIIMLCIRWYLTLQHGHDVMLGTRDPAKLAGWKSQHRGAGVRTSAEAAAFGEMAVLAVKGPVAIDAVRLAGTEN